MRTASLAFALTLVAPLVGQTPSHTSPADTANMMGNTNNVLPFRYAAVHYQQVHDNASWNVNSTTTLIQRIRFRKVNGSTTYTGGNVDIAFHMAQSPNNAMNASATFANNVVANTERNVVVRKQVKLPDLNDSSWSAADFPFDSPFPMLPNTDTSWRVQIWTNTTTAYTLDAWSDWRFGANTSTGACKHPQASQNASHSSTYRGPGNVTDFRGYAWMSQVMPCLLTVGTSLTQWGPIPLPFALDALGAPGCSIVTDWVLPLPGLTQAIASGYCPLSVQVPNDPKLVGQTFFSQFLFFDAGANALGLFTSNGLTNGPIPKPLGVTRIYSTASADATTGTVGVEFCIATALN